MAGAVLAPTLLVGLLLGAGGTAGAAPADGTTDDPAKAAAGYLARRLVDGTHYVFDFDGSTPDAGLTADGVLGMAAAKVAGTAATAATGWLAANSAGYIDAAGEFGGPFPGSYAKLALVAEVTGGDPHAFGGVDLLGELAELECPATGRPECADTPGLFRNTTDDGGFPNTITQSLAILALSRSPVGADRPSAAALDFLAGLQCPDGGFPALFPATGGACESDVDGTGFAVQALVAADRDAVAADALDWLVSVRRPDGSFAGNGVSNSNSTALAVQALLAGDRDAASSVGWLRDRQVGCTGPAAQRGAVTYAGTFDDRALRATAQATMALAGQTLGTVDAAGSAAGAPTLACASTSPTATPTASPTAPATSPPPQAGPDPGLAETNALNRGTVTLLAALGAALIAAGLAATVVARRRE